MRNMAALAFIGLNLIDVWLIREHLGLGAFELNPLAPPIMGNLVARGLMAAALILFVYLVKREKALGLINLTMCGVVFWHLTVYVAVYLAPMLTKSPQVQYLG
jgi:hypothetical protein